MVLTRSLNGGEMSKYTGLIVSGPVCAKE